MKKLLLLSVFLLTSCSPGEIKNFSLNCSGTTSDFSSSNAIITKENRQYEFDEKILKEKNCTIKDKTILCNKEYILGPKLLTRERLIYNTGDYSLNELVQTIGIDETKNIPMYVKTVVFQSSCPMTIKRVKKDS